jgi:hypothetical protein
MRLFAKEVIPHFRREARDRETKGSVGAASR